MPNTVNKALNTPNTGDLPGAWGTAAVNANMTVIDGLFGGVQSVSLTNANVSLSISTGVIGTGSITPGAGPVQSDNAVIKFIGTLTGNCDITFPAPGFWIVENNCTVGSFYVRARAAGTGNLIGIPPGEPCHIYNDGTDAKFVDMGRVGEFLDLCVSTTPAWMSACTVLPYLPCVGTATYSFTTYPALAAMLGSTFGGNGITTFGVPDLGGRVRIPIDNGTRITFPNSGMTGTLLGAAGGNEIMQAHTHVASVTDPGHAHLQFKSGTFNSNTEVTATQTPFASATNPADANLGYRSVGAVAAADVGVGQTKTTGITVSNATTGSGASGNVQPSLVFGRTFIKT